MRNQIGRQAHPANNVYKNSRAFGTAESRRKTGTFDALHKETVRVCNTRANDAFQQPGAQRLAQRVKIKRTGYDKNVDRMAKVIGSAPSPKTSRTMLMLALLQVTSGLRTVVPAKNITASSADPIPPSPANTAKAASNASQTSAVAIFADTRHAGSAARDLSTSKPSAAGHAVAPHIAPRASSRVNADQASRSGTWIDSAVGGAIGGAVGGVLGPIGAAAGMVIGGLFGQAESRALAENDRTTDSTQVRSPSADRVEGGQATTPRAAPVTARAALETSIERYRQAHLPTMPEGALYPWRDLAANHLSRSTSVELLNRLAALKGWAGTPPSDHVHFLRDVYEDWLLNQDVKQLPKTPFQRQLRFLADLGFKIKDIPTSEYRGKTVAEAKEQMAHLFIGGRSPYVKCDRTCGGWGDLKPELRHAILNFVTEHSWPELQRTDQAFNSVVIGSVEHAKLRFAARGMPNYPKASPHAVREQIGRFANGREYTEQMIGEALELAMMRGKSLPSRERLDGTSSRVSPSADSSSPAPASLASDQYRGIFEDFLAAQAAPQLAMASAVNTLAPKVVPHIDTAKVIEEVAKDFNVSMDAHIYYEHLNLDPGRDITFDAIPASGSGKVRDVFKKALEDGTPIRFRRSDPSSPDASSGDFKSLNNQKFFAAWEKLARAKYDTISPSSRQFSYGNLVDTLTGSQWGLELKGVHMIKPRCNMHGRQDLNALLNHYGVPALPDDAALGGAAVFEYRNSLGQSELKIVTYDKVGLPSGIMSCQGVGTLAECVRTPEYFRGQGVDMSMRGFDTAQVVAENPSDARAMVESFFSQTGLTPISEHFDRMMNAERERMQLNNTGNTWKDIGNALLEGLISVPMSLKQAIETQLDPKATRNQKIEAWALFIADAAPGAGAAAGAAKGVGKAMFGVGRQALRNGRAGVPRQQVARFFASAFSEHVVPKLKSFVREVAGLGMDVPWDEVFKKMSQRKSAASASAHPMRSHRPLHRAQQPQGHRHQPLDVQSVVHRSDNGKEIFFKQADDPSLYKATTLRDGGKKVGLASPDFVQVSSSGEATRAFYRVDGQFRVLDGDGMRAATPSELNDLNRKRSILEPAEIGADGIPRYRKMNGAASDGDHLLIHQANGKEVMMPPVGSPLSYRAPVLQAIGPHDEILFVHWDMVGSVKKPGQGETLIANVNGDLYVLKQENGRLRLKDGDQSTMDTYRGCASGRVGGRFKRAPGETVVTLCGMDAPAFYSREQQIALLTDMRETLEPHERHWIDKDIAHLRRQHLVQFRNDDPNFVRLHDAITERKTRITEHNTQRARNKGIDAHLQNPAYTVYEIPDEVINNPNLSYGDILDRLTIHPPSARYKNGNWAAFEMVAYDGNTALAPDFPGQTAGVNVVMSGRYVTGAELHLLDPANRANIDSLASMRAAGAPGGAVIDRSLDTEFRLLANVEANMQKFMAAVERMPRSPGKVLRMDIGVDTGLPPCRSCSHEMDEYAALLNDQVAQFNARNRAEGKNGIQIEAPFKYGFDGKKKDGTMMVDH